MNALRATLLCAAILRTLRIEAQTMRVPVRIQVVRMPGAEGCVDAPTLVGDVTRRLGRAPEAPSARSVDVLIARDREWRATLFAHEQIDGAWRTTSRELTARGPDCGALSAAVGLAVTLAIDPDAPMNVPANDPTNAAVTADGPREEAPVAQCPDAPSARCETRVCPACTSATGRSTGAHLALGVGLSYGVIPSASIVATMHARVGRREGLSLALDAWWFPSKEDDERVATFGAALGAISGCWGFASGRASLPLCLGVAVGLTRAAALRDEPVDPRDRLWLGVRAGARPSLAITDTLAVHMGLDALFPIVQSEFEIEGRRPAVWTPWRVAFSMSIGVGVGF